MDSRIIFATANVQSIRLKELQVSQLISDYSLDFIVLTETWLNSNHGLWKDTCTLNRAQLRLHTADRGEGRGGGLALIIKAQYPCKTIQKGSMSSFEFAVWELKAKSTIITVHGIYHPPYSLTNKITNGRFIEEFTDYVSTSLSKHPNNIYLGDFNLHVSNTLDTDSAIFNDTTEALGLYQHVGFSTHKSGNVLDLVLSDITDRSKILTTAPGPFISDHRAVIGTLSIKRLKPIIKRKLVRQISKVGDQQWGDAFNPMNVTLNGKFDDLVGTFNQELRRVYDTLAPEKECKVHLRQKQPWYDDDMKHHKRKVRKYEKKWLKYKLDSLWTCFKKVRNSYFASLNLKKKESLRTKIEDCSRDSRRLHALVNNLTSKQIEIEWPSHTSTDQLAEDFASYFQDKIDKIRKLLNDKPKYTAPETDAPRLVRFAPMTEKQVSTVIASLKSKSCELDAIPTTILKKMLPEVIPLITKIVNVSLTEGTFCRDWKIAVVRPLLKRLGLELILPNYRLVSNLTFVSKVIERCMLLQLSDHCESYDLQPDYQSAYREHYSCETSVLKVSNDILWGMERQEITSLIALDLSAAFDTVDHDILLSVLRNKYGIHGKALKWFDEYLRPRSFKVAVNGVYSKEHNLDVSVPQGSCAGANIFNLYCSPLQDVVPKGLQLSGFADDHSVRKSFKASNRQEERATNTSLETCLLSIKNWMDEARLKMNPAKTEFIYFGNRRQLQKCEISSINVAGDLILRTDLIKYLGVWFDSGLSFKTHITKKCRAAMTNFTRIRSIRNLLTQEATESLLLSLCISHLDYCNSILYGLPDSTIKKLQRVQNACARLVLRRSKWDSAKDCLSSLHWLPIKQRITFKLCVLTYKLLHAKGPKYLQSLLQYRNPPRTLRSSSDSLLLVIPHTKLKTFAERSFKVAAPTVWNELPFHIRSSSSLPIFKRNLKTHLYKAAFLKT